MAAVATEDHGEYDDHDITIFRINIRQEPQVEAYMSLTKDDDHQLLTEKTGKYKRNGVLLAFLDSMGYTNYNLFCADWSELMKLKGIAVNGKVKIICDRGERKINVPVSINTNNSINGLWVEELVEMLQEALEDFDEVDVSKVNSI